MKLKPNQVIITGQLMDEIWGESDDTYDIVEITIQEVHNWYSEKTVVLKKDDKFYSVKFDDPHTYDDSGPFDDEFVVLDEVKPVEKTVIVYEPVEG